MKKTFLLLISVILSGSFISAQNLVPNPGFETYLNCPTTDGQINKATGWIDPTGTQPDYFNACATSGSGYSVPDNDLGNMAAHTDNAYAGFFTYFSLSLYTELREYMQIMLSSPLEAGKVYNVSFYVTRAQMCEYSASTIGAYFSTTAINPPQNCDGSITPQVENPSSNIISNNTQWTLITGSFTAAGGEEYLTVGNFKTSANSNPVFSGGSASTYSAYYLIDDISVTEDGSVGIADAGDSYTGISLYPNPASDQIHIALPKDKSRNDATFVMYDYTGKEVMRKMLVQGGDQIISTDNISQGLYICKLFSGNMELLREKISVLIK